MMSINDTSELLNSLLSRTNKKSEKKIYNCFIRTLSSLKKKDLTENQAHLIQGKLSSLNLKAIPKNRKKIYKQKLSEFKAFLKNEFSFTSAGYYTEVWMVYGMIFGTGVGLALGIGLGTAFGVGAGTTIGPAIGLSAGTGAGMLFGARKDAEAKRQGRVI
jgi:hypothetical protein